ncbi:hypothetical protein HYFRA_00000775 [Hymenoscyphus fraxineus]|uniref:DUF1770-domain-containing protein n=1 Tax=Hymenoscyphus fraxineus TaxID=746836 RepID=A0A9N9PGQ0_9HELO|nr:hypothetical protein HYFRA_00000775 [Hymenoscyphus fraxineus]
MESSVPLQIAETIQTASIKQNPDPLHDLNPSTAASQKEPVKVSHPSYEYDSEGIDDDEEEDIPYSVLKPLPRRQSFPPLPDLRFEQSYLSSIAGVESYWKIALITVRDQVCAPLLQGMVWNLALQGWKYWNKNAVLHGESVGARARRWWYGVNNWHIPKSFGSDRKLAAKMGDYYQNQSACSD